MNFCGDVVVFFWCFAGGMWWIATCIRGEGCVFTGNSCFGVVDFVVVEVWPLTCAVLEGTFICSSIHPSLSWSGWNGHPDQLSKPL
jgi:hypothetical protein